MRICKNEIKEKVSELGKIITNDYQGKDLVVVGLLKGAFVFMADLIREINLKYEIDFMMVSSYDGMTQKEIRIILDLKTSISGRDVLLVEDIIDTGKTFKEILTHLKSRHPSSLKTCCLLDKKECRKISIQPDYYGFIIPNEFVVGYGMDYNNYYRNMPYIGGYNEIENLER